MRRKRLTLPEEQLLSLLPPPGERVGWNPSFPEWVRGIRVALGMTQADLARRARVTQPHLAGIERGKIDPQVKTLRRIFDALSCDLSLVPCPRVSISEILHDRARQVARDRLSRVTGTMAMEGQIPSEEVINQVVERRALEILHDPGEHLWGGSDE